MSDGIENTIGWGQGDTNNTIGWGQAQEAWCESSPPPTPAPVGATLMKTGQTTSYATGDDGDLQEGRAVDFFTLASNNPFGNTNRFTDELGGSTYTNDIVIDWSTYNGATVLGWHRVYDLSLVIWGDAIDNALSLSIGSFISGWRLPNVIEIMSVYNFSVNVRLNYAPFNLTSVAIQFTSTTNPSNTGRAFTSGASTTNPPVGDILKTSTRNQGIPCRTFTVTGTTLT
jgi:hypothetical protein